MIVIPSSIDIAAGKGDLVKVKALLTKDPKLASQITYGITPLVYAVGNSHKDVAELLLAHGADVNAKDFISSTPLHAARRPIFQMRTQPPER